MSYLDKANYMPNITFGGNHANPAVVTFGNIPYENYNDIISFVDNVSKVIGIAQYQSRYVLRAHREVPGGRDQSARRVQFQQRTTNPFNSGDGFSNALLGVINTYSEGTSASTATGSSTTWSFTFRTTGA